MIEAETMAEIYDREEMAAIVAADALPAVALPAESGRAQAGDGVSSHSSPSAAPAAPLLVEPTPPAPKRRMTLDEINDPARVPIPANYLKGPPEVWRPYLHWFI